MQNTLIPSERIWSNQEAVILRRSGGGYMLVCTAGRAAFLSDLDAENLRAALGIHTSHPDDAATVFAASRLLTAGPLTAAGDPGPPITFTRTPQRRNKPKSRKPSKRPYHRKAPAPQDDAAVLADSPHT